ncbi:hypothetical protein IJI91_03165 [Candidatus Saccharibacteria bacterium]|nr:hypothetical protein [Candidatus Saccharibacteria bacterium]
MNHHYSDVRLTDSIINLTDEPIIMYEETSGAIKCFHPVKNGDECELLNKIIFTKK